MNLELVKCLSSKSNKVIHQFYSTGVKTVSQLSQSKLQYFSKILTEISNEQTSQLSKKLSIYKVEPIYQKKYLSITSQYINNRSLSQTVRDLSLSYKQIDHKQITYLAFDLINKLINDGNRSFFPTQDNIFISSAEIKLNYISFAGLNLVQFKQDGISKLQFLQLSPLLYQHLFQSSTQQTNYVMIKQRAFLIFLLSLINNKQVCFVFLKQMSQQLTFTQIKSLIKTQKNRIIKYFQNKNINEKIKAFQSNAKLSLSKLIDLVLIKEKEISWPQFINQLLQTVKHQNILQQNLHILAEDYWDSRNQYQKKNFIINGFVSVKNISQHYNRIDTDLLLLKLTKTPTIVLYQHGSFIKIINQISSYSLLNYKIWTNFIKILLEHKIAHQSMLKLQSQCQVQYYDHIKQGTKKNKVSAASVRQCENYQQSQSQLVIWKEKKINLQFILDFSTKKLSNKIEAGSKKITLNHQKLSALQQYNAVFR